MVLNIQDKIELLDAQLLKDKKKLRMIDHWLSVMNWPNGWHYDLDIIWVLRHIEQMGLAKGSVIIDAGAGLGVTQFILASSGYNIISLDFADRQIPRFSKNIFTIKKNNNDLGGYTHEYMEFMNYGNKRKAKGTNAQEFYSLLKKVIDLNRFSLNVYTLKNYFKKIVNLSYILELAKDHSGFGKIIFLRGTFNNIPLQDNIADALVSVSAFEHNTYEDMPASISEFMRVIKKGSALIITTSASDKQDWYFKPPKAWNFSRDTLSSWFNISGKRIAFSYGEVFKGIINSKALGNRISSAYKLSADNGLPYGNLKEARYLPVGIIKKKE